MPSKTDIANMALAEIATDPINTIEEASFGARECRRFYDQALRELLEVQDWSFASKRAALAELVINTRSEWAHAYAMPDDCASPRAIRYPGEVYSRGDINEHAYEIEDAVLYTDIAGAVLDYTRTSISESAMPAMFARALALSLALHIVMPIKKDRALKGDLIKQYEMEKERAMADDMNRQPRRDAEYVSAIEVARHGGEACSRRAFVASAPQPALVAPAAMSQPAADDDEWEVRQW